MQSNTQNINEISCTEIIHREQKRFVLSYSYTFETTKLIKTIQGRLWSKTMNAWHIPYSEEIINELNFKFEGKLIFQINTSKNEQFTGINNRLLKISEEQKIFKPNFIQNNKKQVVRTIKDSAYKTLELYVQSLKLRKLSDHTIEIYKSFFIDFLELTDSIPPEDLSISQISAYVFDRTVDCNYSESAFKQMISAIKYYYEKILGRKTMYFRFELKQQIDQVPTSLSFTELFPYLEKANSSSDKLLLYFAYYKTFKPSEIACFTLDDFKKHYKLPEQYNNSQIRNFLKSTISEHFSNIKPKTYLFETQDNIPFLTSDIRTKILRITGYYQMVIVYKRQYENLLLQTDFSYSTQKNYISCF